MTIAHLAVWVLVSIVSVEPPRALNVEALFARLAVRHETPSRMVLAFYYPWYGNPAAKGGSGQWSHWDGVAEATRQIASSTHYPTLGPYDSRDPKLIAQHCTWAKEAGLDGLIVSWWGRGSFEDRAMEAVLDGCNAAGLKATIYYETVPAPKEPKSATEDLLALLRRYAGHPAWLKVEGKPVVFVYGRAVGEIGLDGWLEVAADINRQYQPGTIILGDVLDRKAAAVFDGLHTYNTADRLRAKSVAEARAWARSSYAGWVQIGKGMGRISTITVIPGYDDTKIRKPGLKVERFDGGLYRAQWEEAIAADPDWVLITSWNEWHEGSEVEPSAENGDAYLKMTAEFAAAFKSKPRSAGPQRAWLEDSVPAGEVAALREKLSGVKIACLPGADSAAVFWLLRFGIKPTMLRWEDVPGDRLRSGRFDVLLYAAGEQYRPTVAEPGDVDQAVSQYLQAGGFLLVLPEEPMPFYYNERRQAVDGGSKFGLTLSISGPGGGWESPPSNLDLAFRQVGHTLGHVPERFPFPQAGDRRWRPFVRPAMETEATYQPILELVDGKGRRYGDAIAYGRFDGGRLKGGRILYAWFGLLETGEADVLLFDIFDLLAKELDKRNPGG